jgi:NitT/TauT family transport system permease protein
MTMWKMRATHVVLRILPLVAILAVWELLSRLGVFDWRFFSRPSEIAGVFIDMIMSGELLNHVLISLRRIFLGFALGVVPGIVIGAILGFSRLADMVLGPLVAVVFPIPKLAILPLLMIAFGVGEGSKIALIALGAIFLTLYNTASGVRNLPPLYREVGQSFGTSRLQYITTIALPGALPHIMTGLKLSLQTALLLIVAAEFVGANDGVGQLIWTAWEIFDVRRMFVGLVTLSLIGYLLSLAIDKIEDVLLPWRASELAAATK